MNADKTDNESASEIMKLAENFYEGLSKEDIEEIEKIALDRSNFFGENPHRILEMLDGIDENNIHDAIESGKSVGKKLGNLKAEQKEFDIKMSRRALELASFGIGQVSPSPLVGCVIVAENGKIVGEGSYIFENVTHAEVIALKQAGEKASGGTAYVSLEPHVHFGKTPPCTEALINAGIRRVVCPIEDPNPLVSGKGFAKLRENGIEVVTGILREEAERQNEKFCVWHTKNRPFVHLKLAMSLDGRISLDNTVSTAISGKESAEKVQEMRHASDAILVGGNTAIIDDPNLTDRSGKKRRRKLVRVVLDNRLRISCDSNLVSTAAEFPTIVVSNSTDEKKIAQLIAHGVDVVRENARDLVAVLDALKKRDLQSVLVEGGAEISGAFVDARLVDKVSFMVAPFIIGGNDAPSAIGGNGAYSLENVLRLRDIVVINHGEDFEITGYPNIER